MIRRILKAVLFHSMFQVPMVVIALAIDNRLVAALLILAMTSAHAIATHSNAVVELSHDFTERLRKTIDELSKR